MLAQLWDKMQAGMKKNIFSCSHFLTLREQELARCFFGKEEGLVFFGGFSDAERKKLCFLPDYLDEAYLWEDGPVVCLRAEYYAGDSLNHRDFLGALMGMGISRESVGDICVSEGKCDFFVSREISRFLTESFQNAGRTYLHVKQVPLREAEIPAAHTKEIRDTVSSVRLDSIVSSGFRISRGQAALAIRGGKAMVDGLPCEKPDKILSEGNTVSVRGMGKIRLEKIGDQTRKGRIAVTISRYV